MRTASFFMLALVLLGVGSVAHARDLEADPSTLASVLPTLQPGDTLRLAPGTYAGRIRITSLNGTEAMPIVIEGPADGSAVVEADSGPCCNMLELRDSSHVVLRSITFDGRDIDGAFGISAGPTGAGGSGTRNIVHHITVEDCTFVGFGGSNNHDAISTKTTTWSWVLRRNVFDGAGLGAYFGDSNGGDPFIGGLIEHNAFLRCGGYCMQVKWQTPRPTDWPGMPTEPQVTTIRHNVFHHGDETRFSARPSLLVGGFPSSGPGSDDRYEIYGNLFVHNSREALLQASGRVSIHDNVFVDGDDSVPALVLRAHDLPLRQGWVYGNTFYTSGRAISVGTGDQGTALVGNAIFAGMPSSGTFDESRDNVVGDLAMAEGAFVSASFDIAEMDFHPAGAALMGSAIDLSSFAEDGAVGLDFECRDRGAPVWRGAYEGAEGASSWALALEIKPPLCSAPLPGDPDAGVDTDAGAGADAGVPGTDRDASLPVHDAGINDPDAGAGAPAAGGCGCRVGGASSGAPIALGLMLALVLVRRTRARRGATGGAARAPRRGRRGCARSRRSASAPPRVRPRSASSRAGAGPS